MDGRYAHYEKLKLQREELRSTLDCVKKELAAVDTEITAMDKEKDTGKYCFKVVCMDCDGSGTATSGGADVVSDPPVEVDCECCDGEGYKLAVKFLGKGEKHRIDLDDRKDW